MNNRAIIEFAAKAVGNTHDSFNPIDNSADTSSMCAKLNINYTWMCGYVECWKWDGPSIKIEHDDTDAGKEAAWRLAASIVAAKIGGYKHED